MGRPKRRCFHGVILSLPLGGDSGVERRGYCRTLSNWEFEHLKWHFRDRFREVLLLLLLLIE